MTTVDNTQAAKTRAARRRLRTYRRRWFIAMGIIMALVVASIIVLVLTQVGMLSEEPWVMVGIIVGSLAALASVIVTMIEAAFEPTIGTRRKA